MPGARFVGCCSDVWGIVDVVQDRDGKARAKAAMLIGEILSETAGRLPDKTAIRMAGFAQTFAELDRAANRIANAMIAAGLGKGHNVAILSTNQADYPAIFFGMAIWRCMAAKK